MVHRKQVYYGLKLLLTTGTSITSQLFHVLDLTLTYGVPKSLPYIFLRCDPGGVWKDPPVPDSPSILSWTSFVHMPWWIQALAKREHLRNLNWAADAKPGLGKAWWKQGEAGHWMWHRWGSLRRAVWGRRDLIKDTLRMNVSGMGWHLLRLEEKRFPHKDLVVQMGWNRHAAEVVNVRQGARTEQKYWKLSDCPLVNIFKPNHYSFLQNESSCLSMNYPSVS